MTTRAVQSAEDRRLRALIFLDRLNNKPDAGTAVELSHWMSLSAENARAFLDVADACRAASLDKQLDLNIGDLLGLAKRHFEDDARSTMNLSASSTANHRSTRRFRKRRAL